jgi:type I restriction enzyme R subunit
VRPLERDEVEGPLIAHLERMGWTHLPFSEPRTYSPDSGGSGRDSYTEVVLRQRFGAALRAINPGPDGRLWLDDDRIAAITNRVLRDPERGAAGNLAFTRLLNGAELTVDGLPGWDHGAAQPVRLVDWEHPERNDLLVASQFRVDTPGGRFRYVVLDVVLFVNGLPLVVIECKDPAPTAMDEAVGQLLDYAAAGSPNAAGDLVRFTQLLVATDRENARYGTVTASADRFADWRTDDPAAIAIIGADVDKADVQPLSAQEILVGEMLRPARLLDLVRHFSIGTPAGGRLVKIMARWPQYRAVRRVTAKLLDRQSGPAADPTPAPDHRGGVIWHTQGSGKSLTMAFLVRALRTEPELAGFKVVVITDRLDLEDQIEASLAGTGETVYRTTSVESARSELARRTPDLVLVTIQKAGRDEDVEDRDEDYGAQLDEPVPPVNDSTKILILVDEAHRSHERFQHARLRAMLPNAVLVGFTGTPILSGRRKRTEDIFGTILDAYTLKHAERDRAVVPVTYEAWEVGADVVERAVLDAGFVDAVSGDVAERAQVMAQFARRREVLESENLIATKAAHMFDHWLRNVMPDRFSAQVVAVSRRAAVRYRDSLLAARNRTLSQLDSLTNIERTDPDVLDEHVLFLRGLLPHRQVIEHFDAVPVISAGPAHPTANTPADPPEWRDWTDKARQREHIRRFKAGVGKLPEPDPDPGATDRPEAVGAFQAGLAVGGDPWDEHPSADAGTPGGAAASAEPIAFLTVKSMLLTGFDAPVEQALYLDRPMRSVELLQAIARTNRPAGTKQYGRVVDYVSIGADLVHAMAEYDPDHLNEVIGDTNSQSILAPLDGVAAERLDREYGRIRDLLADQGIADPAGLRRFDIRDQLLSQLDDEGLRASFDEVAKDFLTALNSLLPHPEAMRYQDFAGHLGTVQYLARRRYRDDRERFDPRRYGGKMRQLIDTHIQAEGIRLRILPVEITAADFVTRVERLGDDRAQALELKHALRHHITARLDTDPVAYQQLSERLAEILRRMADDHDLGRVVLDLIGLRTEVLAQETAADDDDLDRWTERPVYALLERATDRLTDESPATLMVGERPIPNFLLRQRARELSLLIADAVDVPHYSTELREILRRNLVNKLTISYSLPWPVAKTTAGELINLAMRSRDEFLRLLHPPR